MKQGMWVSGSNRFNQEDLNNMINLLDKGFIIHVSISCIGHTRNNMEQESYKKALQDYYGDRLQVMPKDGLCSYSYEYQLRESR